MIYECTISHRMIDKNGNEKSVRQTYLVENKELFSQVESTAYEAFGGLVDFDVIAIKRSKLREIINSRENDDEFLFVADVADLQTNDDGEEVELVYKVALFALSMDDAYEKTKAYLSQGYDMSIVGIKKTRLEEVLV